MSHIGSHEIGHRIRVARLALGLSEQEAAARTGMSLRRYRRLENLGTLRSGPLIAVTHAFDVSIDWVVEGDRFTVRPRLVRTSGTIAILPSARTKPTTIRRERTMTGS